MCGPGRPEIPLSERWWIVPCHQHRGPPLCTSEYGRRRLCHAKETGVAKKNGEGTPETGGSCGATTAWRVASTAHTYLDPRPSVGKPLWWHRRRSSSLRAPTMSRAGSRFVVRVPQGRGVSPASPRRTTHAPTGEGLGRRRHQEAARGFTGRVPRRVRRALGQRTAGAATRAARQRCRVQGHEDDPGEASRR